MKIKIVFDSGKEVELTEEEAVEFFYRKSISSPYHIYSPPVDWGKHTWTTTDNNNPWKSSEDRFGC